MIKFVDNAKEVALLHYSTIGLSLGIILALFAPELLYFFFDMEVNPYLRFGWVLGFLFFSLVGKFIVQTHEGRWKRRLVIGIGFLIAVSCSVKVSASVDYCSPDPAAEAAFDNKAFQFISVKEGSVRDAQGWHTAYLDSVGVPTIGYGSTRGVKMGDRIPHWKAKAMLVHEIAEYRHGLHRALTLETLETRLPVTRDVALTSLTYNIGIRAAQRSTFVKRLNDGNIKGACKSGTWWNKGGGRVLLGLVKRREDEYELCMVGVS